MASQSAQTILQFGDPLGFKVAPGQKRSAAITSTGSDTFKVEARALTGHQKEAIVTEGKSGSLWRLACDEGKVMKGDDLAPFPLGFFNVGVISDLHNRLIKSAAQSKIALRKHRIQMTAYYGSDGSFIHSTAEAFAEAMRFKIELDADINGDTAQQLINDTFNSSPAIAYLRTPMTQNTFALYINGRRRKVIDHNNSTAQDAVDPYLAHTTPPRPHADLQRDDLLIKSDAPEIGETTLIPMTNAKKRVFAIDATGAPTKNGTEFKTDTWIARPGMSHFHFTSNETEADTAPSGLALMSAGIGFCYLTQLSRYIDAQKLDITNARLTQFNPYTSGESSNVGPIDTHLFLSGSAPDETHINLLTIAARTCFMHAAATTPIEPELELILNGEKIT